MYGYLRQVDELAGLGFIDFSKHFSNTLQHTAPQCNSLQHTAPHCTTLHHTATHCNTLQQINGYLGQIDELAGLSFIDFSKHFSSLLLIQPCVYLH